RRVHAPTRPCAGRGARPFDEAEERGAVCVDRAALWRAGRAADRDLGHGERLRQPARQPEHALVDCNARLRLPAARIFYRPALWRPETDPGRHGVGQPARLDAWRDRSDAVLAEDDAGIWRRQSGELV